MTGADMNDRAASTSPSEPSPPLAPPAADQGPEANEGVPPVSSWWNRRRVTRKLTYTVLILALISGSATVISATGAGFGLMEVDPAVVVWLLLIDSVLLLTLSAIVVRRFFTVGHEWIRGRAGSKLHTRMVMIFSTVAVTPAVLVAIFATFFLHFGMQSWLTGRVHNIVYQSDAVARSYFQEQQTAVSRETIALANTLNRLPPILLRSPGEMERFMNVQSLERGLDEAAIIHGEDLRVLAAAFSLTGSGYEKLPREMLDKARVGDVHLMADADEDKIRSIMLLRQDPELFLIVGRFVNRQMLAHIATVAKNFDQYRSMESNRSDLEISFVMIFIIATLLLLLAAAALGLVFSNRLMRPISSLIDAAEKVGKGDLSAVAHSGGVDSGEELAQLINSFNLMTERLGVQRSELLDANEELDQRRHFIEAVLAGVSAGVIGLDEEGNISVANRSASRLLEKELNDFLGQPLETVLPNFAPVLQAGLKRSGRRDPVEIIIDGQGGQRTLMASITAEDKGNRVIGYVISFDDVSDLLSAQRKAAWADVARRIAHEIKNPLTPIQLAAERLNRKYLKVIDQDRETFEICTQTIIRHVGDIGRMVEEFRDFARMPQPVMADTNLSELCRQSIFLEQNRNQNLSFETILPDSDIRLLCDPRQIGRALTNLLKNAAEAVVAAIQGTEETGLVRLSAMSHDDHVSIIVEDNGKGFPKEDLHRLTEPYVTTREKGTGLGLAIVKKIIEDHHGELVLGESDLGGARVEAVLFLQHGAQPGSDTQAGDQEKQKIENTVLISNDS